MVSILFNSPTLNHESSSCNLDNAFYIDLILFDTLVFAFDSLIFILFIKFFLLFIMVIVLFLSLFLGIVLFLGVILISFLFV